MDNNDVLFDERQFSAKIGPNLLPEFVKSHDLLDMVVELIQNDFDARSRRARISFAEDRLVVTSRGRKLRGRDWERLTYLLGVPDELAKQGSIGKKNFGLRTLFLAGNRIEVSSGGYRTAFHILLGARQNKIRDTRDYSDDFSFRSETLYRHESLGELSAFTEDREEELFGLVAEHLSHLVRFLVCTKEQSASTQTGGRALLRPYEITVSSGRLHRSITCLAKTWGDRKNTGLVHRKTSLKSQDPMGATARDDRVVDILFSVSGMKPVSLREIPPYYLTRDGRRILVGVSFAVSGRGSGPMVVPGRFYYPIGMRDQWTGLGFSLNAPFQLDMDRDRIVPGDNWNRQLCKRAGINGIKMTPHTHRHTFSTLAYLAGCDKVSVSLLLRHKNENVTDQYLHPSSQQRVQLVREKLERYSPLRLVNDRHRVPLYTPNAR